MKQAEAYAQVAVDAQETEILDILRKFLLELAHLEKEHGTATIMSALNIAMPAFSERSEDEKLEEAIGKAQKVYQGTKEVARWIGNLFTKTGRSRNAAARQLTQAERAGARLTNINAKRAAQGLEPLTNVQMARRGLSPAGATAGAAAVGTAGVAGGTLAGGAVSAVGGIAQEIAGKGWDQDVKIDDINPDLIFNVRAKELEELVLQTTEAINNLATIMLATQKDLGSGFSDLDRNQDDLLGAQIGLSGREVSSQQGVRGTVMPQPDDEESDEPDKEKIAGAPIKPVRKKDNEDKKDS